MALSEPTINFNQGLGVKIVAADNPGAQRVDITISQKAPLTIVIAGPLPTVDAPGLELRVPTLNGVAGVFNLLAMFSRLTAAPAGTVQFRLEKSTTHGAFAPVSIGGTTHAAGEFEKTTALASTIASGDLIRLYYVDMSGGMGGAYEVELTGTLQ